MAYPKFTVRKVERNDECYCERQSVRQEKNRVMALTIKLDLRQFSII